MKPSIFVSQVRFDPATSRFLVRGWVDAIEDVSQIVFRGGGTQVCAILGTRRLDVLKAHGHVTTAYCGFEAALEGGGDSDLELFAYGRHGELIKQQKLQRQTAMVVKADVARFSVVQRVHERHLSRFSVLVRSARGLGGDAGLQIGDAEPQPLREIQPVQAKALYAAETSDAVRYYHAGVPLAAGADLEALAAAPLRLHAGREILELAELPEVVTRSEPRAWIGAATWFEKNGVLNVSGETGSMSISSVRLVIGGRMIAANPVFMDPRAAKAADCTAHFFMEALHPLPPETGSTVRVEFLVGDEVVHTAERRVSTNSSARAPLPAGPSTDSHGGMIYEFPVSPERASLPWVAVFTGMPAWPSEGGATARTNSLARHLRTCGYRVLLVAHSVKGAHNWVPNLAELCDALVLARSEPVGDKYGHVDVGTYRRSNSAALRILLSLDAHFAPRAFILNYAFNMYGTVGLRAPVILDTHDVQYLRAANARKHGGNLEDRRCTRAEESRLLSMADSVLAISPTEVGELEALKSGRPVLLVPHAQEPFETTPVTAESLHRLFFVGQKYAPNIDGIRAFITDVWPSLIAKCPMMELHVAGRVCEALGDLQAPGITLHGQVASLDPFYEMCGIVLNPAPYGTGLKIKAVEGLARGRCVVATPEGRRGLPDEAPMLTVPIKGFAEAILALVADPDAAIALATAAKDYALDAFSADRIYAPVVDRLAALPERPKIGDSALVLAEHALYGADLGLGFDVPPGTVSIPLTVVLTHAGIDLFRVTTVVAASTTGGRVWVRVPFPSWLGDGLHHTFDLRWGHGGRAAISVAATRDQLEAVAPNIIPAWGAFANTTESLWLVEPPVRIEQRPMGVSRQRPRAFDIRLRNRLLARAWGWVPTPQPHGAELLAYLNFSHDVSAGDPTHNLCFYDQQSGLLAACLPRAVMPRRTINDMKLRSLAPVDDVWHRTWPIHIDQGGVVKVDDLVDIAAGPDGLIRDWLRLVTVIQAKRPVTKLSLLFGADADEESVVRWSVFLDGVPCKLQTELEFRPRAVLSHHSVNLHPSDIARLELHGYPGFGTLARPKLLRIG